MLVAWRASMLTSQISVGTNGSYTRLGIMPITVAVSVICLTHDIITPPC